MWSNLFALWFAAQERRQTNVTLMLQSSSNLTAPNFAFFYNPNKDKSSSAVNVIVPFIDCSREADKFIRFLPGKVYDQHQRFPRQTIQSNLILVLSSYSLYWQFVTCSVNLQWLTTCCLIFLSCSLHSALLLHEKINLHPVTFVKLTQTCGYNNFWHPEIIVAHWFWLLTCLLPDFCT